LFSTTACTFSSSTIVGGFSPSLAMICTPMCERCFQRSRPRTVRAVAICMPDPYADGGVACRRRPGRLHLKRSHNITTTTNNAFAGRPPDRPSVGDVDV
jgi:hypothetical protein